MRDKVAASLPQKLSKNVDPVVVKKAVEALQKRTAPQDAQLLYLVVGMKKAPGRGRINPYSVPLPHPLYDSNHEVCLIISDRPYGKEKLNKEKAKEQIEKEGLKIAKILTLPNLKKDYASVEAKRKLCGSYDVFLADERIFGELPKLLDKSFYKKKHPIPVTLTKGAWGEHVTLALNSTFMFVSGGTCSVVKVARVSQPWEQIVANVKAVMEGVAQQIPKKWGNIQAYHLKTLESVALPLYQSRPDNLPLEIESLQPSKKRLKLAQGDSRLLKNEEEDMVQETVVSERPKNRKRKFVEGKQKALSTGA
jgi:ribosome biogenesis protein UTP30